MRTDLKAFVTTTDKDAQYDTCAKHLLARKIILAHILVNTIDEFKGMDPKDVTQYIEGTIHIEKVPVDPGYTNRKDPEFGKISGFNTEDDEINEGMIKYDIIFYVNTKEGSAQIIVNIEPQKNEPSKYPILNRSIFYICRMVSSQKNREFLHMEYGNIKRVYSIWICMNTEENSMSHIHLAKDDIIGVRRWKGDLDLLNIFLISLTGYIPVKEEGYKLHRLLGSLLSSKLSVDNKLNILANDYHIPIDAELRKDVNEMYTLSQAVREEGYAIGHVEGHAEGRIEGRAEEVYSSVMEGDYSIRRGMEKLHVQDEAAFRKDAAKAGFILPEE